MILKRIMGENMNESKKYVLIFIFGLVIGFFAGHFLVKENSTEIASVGGVSSALELRYVSGKVIDVKTGSFVMEIDQIGKNPDGIPATRTVILNHDTQFVRFRQKTTQELQEDTDKYGEFAKSADGEVNFPPPGSFKEVPISMDEITAGSYIVVDAGQDIMETSEFIALKIMVQDREQL